VRKKVSQATRLEEYTHLYDILVEIADKTKDLDKTELKMLMRSLNKCYDQYVANQVTLTMASEDYRKVFKTID